MCRSNFILVLLTVCLSSFAQDKALLLVKYKLIHVYDTTKPDNPGEEVMQLKVSKSAAAFSSFEYESEYSKYLQGSGFTRQPDGRMVHGSTYPAIYVMKSHNILYHFYGQKKAYWMYNDIFHFYIGYAFDLPDVQWTITDEKKLIANIPCQKATGWVRGRLYDAWFAPSLPFPTGPGKLYGLPGLVLEAHDAKNQVQFRFVSIENIENENKTVQLEKKSKVTTRTKYEGLMETFYKNPFAMSVVSYAISEEAADQFLKDNAELIAKQKLVNSQKTNVKINNPIDLTEN
jgi:GLPGLI family protein